jgi:uncharacterized protein
MSDPKSANSDPSMDDILASIRKIISDDEARAQAAGQQAAAQHSKGPSVAPPAEPRLNAGRDDVLLLTDLIEEPGAAGTVAPPPIPMPRIDPVRAAEMPQPSFEPVRSDSTLVGGGAAASASSAFSRLSQAVEESVPQPAAQDPGPVVGTSGKTVEDLVRETLRPMLKEWLDRNLPQVVERYVEREIVRLTRR